MIKELINTIKNILFNQTNEVILSTKSTAKHPPKSYTINKNQRINQIEKKLHLFANIIQPNNWSPSRFIYKVGVLKLVDATDNLLRIAQNESKLLEDATFRYSLIWALGRCGDANVLPIISNIAQANDGDYMHRLILNIYLQLSPDNTRNNLLEKITSLLPKTTLEIIKNKSFENLSTETLDLIFSQKSEDSLPPIYTLYLLSNIHQEWRPLIVKYIKALPFEFPYFQTIRYIFKAAEYWDDYEVLGLLAYRFDTNRATYTTKFTWHWDKKTQTYIKKSIKAPNKAFSNLTKGYFQKRILRNIQLLGEQENIGFCDYAVALLQHYRNKEAVPTPENTSNYRFNQNTRRWDYIQTNYQRFSSICLPFLSISRPKANQATIIWQNSKYRFTDSYYQESINNKKIPFASIWQQHPEKACLLLQYCQSDAVAKFALTILKGHEQEKALITEKVLFQLLKSPINTVAFYAIEQLPRFFDTSTPNWNIMRSMLQAPNKQIRTYALDKIQQHPSEYFKAPELVEIIALSTKNDLADWFSYNASKLEITASEKQSIFEKLCFKIQKLQYETDAEILYNNSLLFFKEQLKQTMPQQAQQLLVHPLEYVQLLGADMLLQQKEAIQNIPEDLIMKMLAAPLLSIRAKGIALFGALPTAVLLDKKDILINMLISEQAEIRAAVKPVIAQTANENSAWGIQLVQFFAPILLQKEKYEGLHEDILNFLIEYLDTHLSKIQPTTIWKLIQTRYRAANLLGLELLQYLDFSKESLYAIISLANHEMPRIRQYCFEYFNKNIGRIRYESTEALTLLDAKWEDSREFGFDFFEKNYKASDWSPELLVSVCDSTRLDVQEYGKKMITKFFDAEKGLDYLMQLSQHPSIALQYFVTDYLKRFAGDNRHHFIQLKPYFKTVLCQLYKGGTTKRVIFNFLEDKALNDQAIAAHVIEIINDVSLTISIWDKARCIQILHAIKAAYPNLDTALRIQAIAIR